jgi:hypothetical protein
MTTAASAEKPSVIGDPGVRRYEIVCVTALLVLTWILIEKGYGTWCFLPMLAGLLGVVARLRLGPVMLLMSLQFQIIDQWTSGWGPPVGSATFEIEDLLQAAAVLAYIAGQYRLLGLTRNLLPSRPRVKPMPARRLVSMREIVLLIMTVLLYATLAQLITEFLPDSWYELGLAPRAWRMIVLAWTVGIGAVVVGGLLGHLARQRMSPTEATLILQDVLWQQTRGEQRLAGRWLAWARLRFQRRKEMS